VPPKNRFQHIEFSALSYFVLAYAVAGFLGGIASNIGPSWKWAASLTTNSFIYIPAILFAIVLLIRCTLKTSDDVAEFLRSNLKFNALLDMRECHREAMKRMKSKDVTYIYVTYLNPDGFTNDQPTFLKNYYKEAEGIKVKEYKRIFAIYPDTEAYRTRRQKAVEWLRGHANRTAHLHGYHARYIELTIQAADVLIDDNAVSFSFPVTSEHEMAWIIYEDKTKDHIKHYFFQIWEKSKDINELLIDNIL
jgi:hypothetical protein